MAAIYPRFTHESGTIRKKQAIDVSKLKRLLCYESQHQSQSTEKSLVQFDYEKAVSNYLGTQSTFNPNPCIFLHTISRNVGSPPRPPSCVPGTIQYWWWQSRVKAENKPTRVAAPLPRAKPRTAFGVRAHGTASAAGLRSAMKLKLYGYTGGCKFSSCCRSAQNPREKWL